MLRTYRRYPFLEPDKGPSGGGTPPPAPASPPVDAPPAPATAPPVAEAPAEKPAAKPGVFERAGAFIRDRGALATEISSRDGIISDLRAQLASRDGTISALQGELKVLKDGAAQLEQAITAATSTASTVAETVAGLGFPPSQLPAASSSDAPSSDSLEGLQAQFVAAETPEKKSEIAERMIALRDKAAK